MHHNKVFCTETKEVQEGRGVGVNASEGNAVLGAVINCQYSLFESQKPIVNLKLHFACLIQCKTIFTNN